MLAEPSHPSGQSAAAPLTPVHITLHLHTTLDFAASLLQLGVQQETQNRHTAQMLIDQTLGYISQRALIAGGLSAITVHIS